MAGLLRARLRLRLRLHGLQRVQLTSSGFTEVAFSAGYSSAGNHNDPSWTSPVGFLQLRRNMCLSRVKPSTALTASIVPTARRGNVSIAPRDREQERGGPKRYFAKSIFGHENDSTTPTPSSLGHFSDNMSRSSSSGRLSNNNLDTFNSEVGSGGTSVGRSSSLKSQRGRFAVNHNNREREGKESSFSSSTSDQKLRPQPTSKTTVRKHIFSVNRGAGGQMASRLDAYLADPDTAKALLTSSSTSRITSAEKQNRTRKTATTITLPSHRNRHERDFSRGQDSASVKLGPTLGPISSSNATNINSDTASGDMDGPEANPCVSERVFASAPAIATAVVDGENRALLRAVNDSAGCSNSGPGSIDNLGRFVTQSDLRRLRDDLRTWSLRALEPKFSPVPMQSSGNGDGDGDGDGSGDGVFDGNNRSLTVSRFASARGTASELRELLKLHAKALSSLHMWELGRMVKVLGELDDPDTALWLFHAHIREPDANAFACVMRVLLQNGRWQDSLGFLPSISTAWTAISPGAVPASMFFESIPLLMLGIETFAAAADAGSAANATRADFAEEATVRTESSSVKFARLAVGLLGELELVIASKPLAETQDSILQAYVFCIAACGAASLLDTAEQVFSRAPRRTSDMYAAVMNACVDAGKWMRAIEYFSRIDGGMGASHSARTLAAAMAAYAMCGDWSHVLRLHEALSELFSADHDSRTFSLAIQASAHLEAWEKTLELFEEALERALDVGDESVALVIEALDRAEPDSDAADEIVDDFFDEALRRGWLSLPNAVPDTVNVRGLRPSAALASIRRGLRAFVEPTGEDRPHDDGDDASPARRHFDIIVGRSSAESEQPFLQHSRAQKLPASRPLADITVEAVESTLNAMGLTWTRMTEDGSTLRVRVFGDSIFDWNAQIRETA